MKLFSSKTSPFVRKVRVLMIEAGIADKVSEEVIGTTPLNTNAELAASNPVGKIPCLITDDGQALYDSRTVCEYLDSELAGGKLFPAGAARWDALRRQSLGDGIMDAGVLSRYEAAMRPEEKRWEEWSAAQRAKIVRSLDAMNKEAGTWGGDLDIGDIACACAIGYLDFRYGDMNWRNGRDALAKWYEKMAARPSMQQTMPAD
jgi:glutathione S-transferase